MPFSAGPFCCRLEHRFGSLGPAGHAARKAMLLLPRLRLRRVGTIMMRP